MIEWKIKLWRSAGVAALVGLAACGDTGVGKTDDTTAADTPPAAAGEAGEAAAGESGAEHGEAGVATAYAGLEGEARTALRLQHLKGFLLIADRVAEAGSNEEAAILVSQGVLEVYDPAADQFGALNVAPVRAAGEPAANAAATARNIRAAEAAIDAARGPLSFDHADTAARMVDLSTGLYTGVVQADFADPIEYQHSLGAALSARDALVSGEAALKAENAGAYTEALAEIDRLIALWPQVTAPETPATLQQVSRQASRVRLALSPFL